MHHHEPPARGSARGAHGSARSSRATVLSVAPLDSALLAELQAALRAEPGLSLAVLFGSQATGRAREESDFDIGVLPTSPDYSLRDELALASSLSAITRTEIDLVRLDGDNPLLLREIALQGVCLFERTPGLFAERRARALSEWIDFDELVAPHRRRFLERLSRTRP